MQILAERSEMVHNGSVDATVDNMLKITGLFLLFIVGQFLLFVIAVYGNITENSLYALLRRGSGGIFRINLLHYTIWISLGNRLM